MSTVDERMGDFFRNMVSGRKCLAEVLASTKSDSELHKTVSELNVAFETFLDVCDAWDYDIDESVLLSGKMCVAKQSGDWFSPSTWVDGKVPNLDSDESHVIIIPDGVTVTGVPTTAVTFSTECGKPEETTPPSPPPAVPSPSIPVESATSAPPAPAPAPVPTSPVPAPDSASPAPTPVPAPPLVSEPKPVVVDSTAATTTALNIKSLQVPSEGKTKKKVKKDEPRRKAWMRKKIPIGVIARSVSQRRTRRK